MFDWFLDWLIEVAISVVELFPLADVAELTDAIAPAGRFISWIAQLDEFIPISESMAMLGMLLSIVVALYVVMTARRVFSLIWPGAGS